MRCARPLPIPGNVSSSLAGAVLMLIRGDVARFSAFEKEVRSVATERERLAHAANEKMRTNRSSAEVSRMSLRTLAAAAGKCNLLEVLQNKNL